MSSDPLDALGPIGLGCVTFGREIDATASFALLDHALARGVTHLDTAAVYGAGASEDIVGQWLASRRPRGIVVATKAVPPYTAGPLAASIEGSLRRLGVDTIDLFYLHRWDATLTDETLALLDASVRDGKIRALGVSNIAPTQLTAVLARQRALGFTPFRVLQCNQNLAVTELDAPMRAVCAEHALRVVTFSPLGAGFLTGKHRDGVAPGSRFELIPGHQSIYFQPTARARLERLLALAARTGQAPAHLALVWALHRPEVACVLVGGRTPAHLDQAFAARADDDATLLAELDAIRN